MIKFKKMANTKNKKKTTKVAKTKKKAPKNKPVETETDEEVLDAPPILREGENNEYFTNEANESQEMPGEGILKKTRPERTEDKKISKEEQKKIESLKGVIDEAEKNIFALRSMLSRLEGKNKPAVQKRTYGATPDGKLIEGVFDGQVMIGHDGKQYPVPANYASKSKLAEGDLLKLTVVDGNFIYKQIGPIERKRLFGMVQEDETGNYVIQAEGRVYKVLRASVTYFKAQPGDEVTIIVPKDGDAMWCAIENVTKKAGFSDGAEPQIVDYAEEQDPFVQKEAEPKVEEPEKEEKKVSKKIIQKKTALKTAFKTPLNEKRGNLPGINQVGGVAPADDSSAKRDMSQIIEEWTPALSDLEKETTNLEKSVKDAGTEEAAAGAETTADAKDDGSKVKIKVGGGAAAADQGLVTKDFPDTPEEILNKQ